MLGSFNLFFSKPLCLCAQPMSLIDKIRFIYFYLVCLILGSPNLHFSKSLCLCTESISPIEKIRYIYFVVAYLMLGSLNLYLSRPLCLCASPGASFTKSTIYILWSCAWYWRVSWCICQNHCACVLAHEPHSQNPLYLFCGRVPDLGEPHYVFAKITVPPCLPMSLIHKIHYIFFVAVCLILGSPVIYLPKPLCLCACPWASFTKSTISILWSSAWSWEPNYIFA